MACCSGAVLAMSVVFINPGKSDEIYWLTAARAMQAAARSLDVQLEVLYAERDHPRQLVFARQLAARPPQRRPDYVIMSNDYAVGLEMLRILDAAGIKTFFAFSGINDPRERQQSGGARERYRGWLGSLEPRADEAGYLTAQALIAHGRKTALLAADGKLHLLALAGDRSTPTSILRNEGMRRAVAEAGDVIVDQEVYAAWNRAKAAEQSDWLFQRYPEARLVWSGNDQMAFGAMQSWEKRGGKPGQDAWFSAINTSQEALAALQSGRLTALAGGHFIAGAWALVLLYDYHHGRDFAGEGLEMAQSMFMLFSRAEAARFQARFGDLNFNRLDFRRYSKVYNPRLKRYDFNFRQLLN
ncbi:MAG: ABC transporter substrate-binding protein [Burkholderiales bacterium]|nr:ABC transporter substrate-binding protein [Burkholderiales bacterium]